jgi:hypothetical protein
LFEVGDRLGKVLLPTLRFAPRGYVRHIGIVSFSVDVRFAWGSIRTTPCVGEYVDLQDVT